MPTQINPYLWRWQFQPPRNVDVEQLVKALRKEDARAQSQDARITRRGVEICVLEPEKGILVVEKKIVIPNTIVRFLGNPGTFRYEGLLSARDEGLLVGEYKPEEANVFIRGRRSTYRDNAYSSVEFPLMLGCVNRDLLITALTQRG